MGSNPSSEPTSSNSPTLWIDFRNGNVVMLHGPDRWQGELPMSKADCSQINTAGGLTVLAKMPSSDSEPLPAVEA